MSYKNRLTELSDTNKYIVIAIMVVAQTIIILAYKYYYFSAVYQK